MRSISPVYSMWRKLRLSGVGRSVASALADRITPRRLQRLAAAARLEDPSYALEWPYLRALLVRTALLTDDRWALDIAAGDGVTQSSTLPLFRDYGWHGIAIEQDATKYALLERTYAEFPRVRLRRVSISPDNVVEVLRELGAPLEPALVNIDIDSFDLPLVDALLVEFQPLILDIEINEKVPPPIRFAVQATKAFEYDEGHCYGCSLSAAVDVIIPRGYRLAGLQYNNAFFVRDDVAQHSGIESADPASAYHAGYLAKADRRTWFPWNHDMENVHALAPDDAVAWLRRRFGPGKSYILQTTPLERTQLHAGDD